MLLIENFLKFCPWGVGGQGWVEVLGPGCSSPWESTEGWLVSSWEGEAGAAAGEGRFSGGISHWVLHCLSICLCLSVYPGKLEDTK